MKVVFQVPQDGQYGLDIYTRERFLNLKEMDIFNRPAAMILFGNIFVCLKYISHFRWEDKMLHVCKYLINCDV